MAVALACEGFLFLFRVGLAPDEAASTTNEANDTEMLVVGVLSLPSSLLMRVVLPPALLPSSAAMSLQ